MIFPSLKRITVFKALRGTAIAAKSVNLVVSIHGEHFDKSIVGNAKGLPAGGWQNLLSTSR
jgi:hypothetical protein